MSANELELQNAALTARIELLENTFRHLFYPKQDKEWRGKCSICGMDKDDTVHLYLKES